MLIFETQMRWYKKSDMCFEFVFWEGITLTMQASVPLNMPVEPVCNDHLYNKIYYL